MLNISAIETRNGWYLFDEGDIEKPPYSKSSLLGYLINSEKPQITFDKQWVKVLNKPEQIVKLTNQGYGNRRYELQDKSFSDKLPEIIMAKDVEVRDEDSREWNWNDEMKQYRSLYKLIRDKLPDKQENIEFTLTVLMTVDDISEPTKMAYPTIAKYGEFSQSVTEKSVHYQLLDKLVFPPIMLHERPCKLTSKQTYDIVRKYIKDNIDPKVVKITSDYDFCFTVSKRILLAEPKHYTVDVNAGRRGRPKRVNKTKLEKEKSCFSMTYSPENYKGYPPIKGFTANSQKELKEQIDQYCEELIEFINSPLKECKTCNGTGYMWNDNEKI